MQTLVYFSISNAANAPLTGSNNQNNISNYVTLAPQSYPLNNNESILDADVITYVPDSNGTFTASLYPQFYKGYIKGSNTHTHFLLNVPTGSAVNAADYLVVLSSSVINPGKYAYSMAASDARYIQGTNGTASYAVSSSYTITASFAQNAYAVAPVFYDSDNGNYYGLSIKGNTGSEVIQIDAVTYNSQSGIFSNVSASYSITSSYSLNSGNQISCSWSSQSLSSSWSPNQGTNLTTASTYPITSSWSNSSISCSFITSSNVIGTVASASFVATASSANTSSFLRLWDSGLNSWVTITSFNGILNIN